MQSLMNILIHVFIAASWFCSGYLKGKRDTFKKLEKDCKQSLNEYEERAKAWRESIVERNEKEIEDVDKNAE